MKENNFLKVKENAKNKTKIEIRFRRDKNTRGPTARQEEGRKGGEKKEDNQEREKNNLGERKG